jgi:parallel beta-helix repeat protein
VCSGCATGLTGTPYGVSGTRAAVFGSVVSDTGGEVEYWAEYGTTTVYGSQTAHETITVSQNSQQPFILQIQGLQRATTYHYRICARDSQQKGGPGCGQDAQLTTVNVDCGDTITADLHVSGNLDCIRTGGRDGPIVGAHGIEVDLTGHEITGINRALDNRGGFDDVTIRGGALYSYDVGLELDGASRNRIIGVDAGRRLDPFAGPSTSVGIQIKGGEANVVRHSSVEGSSTGLRATDSTGLLVADSTGVAGAGSRGGGAAVSITGSLARVLRNGFGAMIAVDGSSNRIVGNTVSRPVYSGIMVSGGHDNLVGENTVRDASTLPFAPDVGDGILVQAAAVDTRLRGNVVTGSYDDGIDVRSATTRLRDNRADDNTDFGIDAVPGVIDLGGNSASGNGNPLQCRNVFCAAG